MHDRFLWQCPNTFQHQIHQIADSIKAYGSAHPILIDNNNTIIAGHGRVAAVEVPARQKLISARWIFIRKRDAG